MEIKDNLIITPKTKVFQLLEAYPQLEETLIGFVPAFKKLKNPVLRKTVAKITTLQQAATIGGVKTGELVNLLRKEVGQDLLSDSAESTYNTIRPGWFDEKNISGELDIRDMLAAGEQPVNQAMADLNDLKQGCIYKITAPFIPAPLIDKAGSLNISHWLVKENEELFRIYFYKA